MTALDVALPTVNAVRERIASAETPALLMLVAHVTGDVSVLRPEWRPDTVALPQSGLPAGVDHEIRAFALERLAPHLDGAAPWPTEPGPGILEAIGDWSIGPEVTQSPLLLHSAFVPDGTDPKAPVWTVDELAPGRTITAVVVGAGLSGLMVALRLKQAGVDFTIIDKDADVGGTWWENTYPDCRIDVHSHIYTYSFFAEDWPSYFSRQHVIQGYLRRFAEENGLIEHIEFNTEVVRADWNDTEKVWKVTVRDTNGVESVRDSNVFVSAVGQLNRPSVPDLEGMDEFQGPAFHSANWDHDVDFTGKRVVIVGTGASALQFGPAIARIAEHVTIFQRTAPWLMPTPELRQDIEDDERWLFQNLPDYRAYYRLSLFLPRAIGQLDAATVDHDFPPTEKSVSAANEGLRLQLTEYLRRQAGSDKELFEKIVPDYPPGSKRIVRDDGTWVSTLKRDNVDLVKDRVVKVDATGVITGAGEHVDADIIVFGTGFLASDYLTPMKITGIGGRDLHEEWGIDAAAYYGMTVPAYPNLFVMYGPNTNLVLHGNLVFFLEAQGGYIADAVRVLAESGKAGLSLRKDVFDAYKEEVTIESAKRAWGWSKSHSWYQNAEGRSTIMWPLTAQRYIEGTAQVVVDEYELI